MHDAFFMHKQTAVIAVMDSCKAFFLSFFTFVYLTNLSFTVPNLVNEALFKAPYCLFHLILNELNDLSCCFGKTSMRVKKKIIQYYPAMTKVG